MDEKNIENRARILIILILIIITASPIYFFVIKGQAPADLLSGAVTPCREFPIAKSSRMAIIRIDDIQAYSLEDVSIKMMDDAKALSIPIVLGVIPKGMEYDTPIRRYLEENFCWVEIAQHGWDHNGPTSSTPEFGAADFEAASSEIMQGKVILEDIAQEKITTFIPPMNSMSDGARRAVSEADIQIISSQGKNEFDYDATTFNFVTDKINSTEIILRDCGKRITRASSCVVMMHPQDFTTNKVFDPSKYQVYLDTLAMLKSDGYTFVRFKDLVKAE